MTQAAPAPLNRLRKLWQERRPTFGAIATIPSIQTVQIMARSGLDWIIVDLEHGPIDLGSAHAMITATAGTPCIPLARIAANEPWLAKAPMDIGALGINFPMICSRQDAEKAVRSVRYPPRGDRLWGPFHAPFRWGVSISDYMATADDDMICMITIEHVDAVERIDEIMATPGIDIAVIGPGDLATSIDKRGRIDDPEVQALIARAEAGILKSGVPIGGVARTAEQANAMIDRGYLALALGFDWSLFQRGIAASFEGHPALKLGYFQYPQGYRTAAKSKHIQGDCDNMRWASRRTAYSKGWRQAGRFVLDEVQVTGQPGRPVRCCGT